MISSFHLTRLCVAVSLALVIAGCASPRLQDIQPTQEDISHYQNMTGNAAIAELEESLAKLRVSQDLNFFAPSHFELVSRSLDDARSKAAVNASDSQIALKVATAEAVLRNGQRVAKQVKDLLEEEIAIKQSLDNLNTRDTYASEYSSLVDRMSQIIRDIENGKKSRAEELRPQLLQDMQELEVRAIRHEALHEAEEMLMRVSNNGGADLTPITYRDAMAVFTRAEEFINANAHDRASVKKVAAEALFAAKRALSILGEVAALNHKSRQSLEQIVLDEEFRLYRIARRLGIDDPRSQPLEVQSEILSKAVASIIEERSNNEQMAEILSDAVARQAEINNEPALLEEIRNLKRERSELLAKESLYTTKLAELRERLETTQKRAINAESKLETLIAQQTTIQPASTAVISPADETTPSQENTPAAEGTATEFGAFANSAP